MEKTTQFNGPYGHGSTDLSDFAQTSSRDGGCITSDTNQTPFNTRSVSEQPSPKIFFWNGIQPSAEDLSYLNDPISYNHADVRMRKSIQIIWSRLTKNQLLRLSYYYEAKDVSSTKKRPENFRRYVTCVPLTGSRPMQTLNELISNQIIKGNGYIINGINAVKSQTDKIKCTNSQALESMLGKSFSYLEETNNNFKDFFEQKILKHSYVSTSKDMWLVLCQMAYDPIDESIMEKIYTNSHDCFHVSKEVINKMREIDMPFRYFVEVLGQTQVDNAFYKLEQWAEQNPLSC